MIIAFIITWNCQSTKLSFSLLMRWTTPTFTTLGVRCWATSPSIYLPTVHLLLPSLMPSSTSECKLWLIQSTSTHKQNLNFGIGTKPEVFLTLEKVSTYVQPSDCCFSQFSSSRCCREYDNCLREDLSLAQRQHRARHVALMIAELFNTIKEGDLRVFVFAEQIVHLCHLLTQCPTNSTVRNCFTPTISLITIS